MIPLVLTHDRLVLHISTGSNYYEEILGNQCWELSEWLVVVVLASPIVHSINHTEHSDF